jgi:hypothetical protein
MTASSELKSAEAVYGGGWRGLMNDLPVDGAVDRGHPPCTKTCIRPGQFDSTPPSPGRANPATSSLTGPSHLTRADAWSAGVWGGLRRPSRRRWLSGPACTVLSAGDSGSMGSGKGALIATVRPGRAIEDRGHQIDCIGSGGLGDNLGDGGKAVPQAQPQLLREQGPEPPPRPHPLGDLGYQLEGQRRGFGGGTVLVVPTSRLRSDRR